MWFPVIHHDLSDFCELRDLTCELRDQICELRDYIGKYLAGIC